MTDIKLGRLVAFFKDGKRLWGFTQRHSDSGQVYIQVGKDQNDNMLARHDSIQQIPTVEELGPEDTDPKKVARENYSQILLYILLEMAKLMGMVDSEESEAKLPEPPSEVPIPPGTLSIILPGDHKPTSACWGLTQKPGVKGETHDVQIGKTNWLKKGLKRLNVKVPSTPIVQSKKIVPVLLTDGSFKTPDDAVEANTDELLRLALDLLHNLNLHFNGKSIAEQRAAVADSVRNHPKIVFLRRREKSPPASQEKKPK